jgi:hypothetical protein
MFQFINNSYFDKLKLTLPNTSLSYDGEVLRLLIEDEQINYLQIILGSELATLFIDGISQVTDSSLGTTDAKWLNLLFGKKDINNGYSNDWLGFSNHHVYILDDIGNTSRTSPYANYIYKMMIESKITTTFGQGEAQPNFENSTLSIPYIKLMRSWNDMVKYHYQMHNFIMENISDYPSYVGVKYPPIENINLHNTIFDRLHFMPRIENENQNYFIKKNILSI